MKKGPKKMPQLKRPAAIRNCGDIGCDKRSEWCRVCGACPHEAHTEKCRQEWRDLILSYPSPKPLEIDYNRYVYLREITLLDEEMKERRLCDPEPAPFCVGVRGCQAKLHANDCPEWTE